MNITAATYDWDFKMETAKITLVTGGLALYFETAGARQRPVVTS